MSQYCSPEAVLTPSPVTLVGALVLGRTACVAGLCVAVCADTAHDNATTTNMTIAFFVIIIIHAPQYSATRLKALLKRDDVDFHQHFPGQARNFDGGARGRRR